MTAWRRGRASSTPRVVPSTAARAGRRSRHVFPEGVADAADAVAVLIRVPDSALEAADADVRATGGLLAYSKLCTHAGCPVGLYVDDRRTLLCPCHQSEFDVLDGGRPLSGPAACPLPRLPLSIHADGALVAHGDFDAPVGPGGGRGDCGLAAIDVRTADFAAGGGLGCSGGAAHGVWQRADAQCTATERRGGHTTAVVCWLMFVTAVAVGIVVAALILWGALRRRVRTHDRWATTPSSRSAASASRRSSWSASPSSPSSPPRCAATGGRRRSAVDRDRRAAVLVGGQVSRQRRRHRERDHDPRDRPVELTLRSADVIHSFWVPELAGKQDLIPGRPTARARAERTGRTGGVRRVLRDPARRDGLRRPRPRRRRLRRLERRAGADRTVAVGPGRTRPEVFDAAPCGGCHRIDGTAANGDVGPDLTHLATRATLGAGVLDNTPENLAHWITSVDEVKPGRRCRRSSSATTTSTRSSPTWRRRDDRGRPRTRRRHRRTARGDRSDARRAGSLRAHAGSGRTRPASRASSPPSTTSASGCATSTPRSRSSSSPGSRRSSCASSSRPPRPTCSARRRTTSCSRCTARR